MRFRLQLAVVLAHVFIFYSWKSSDGWKRSGWMTDKCHVNWLLDAVGLGPILGLQWPQCARKVRLLNLEVSGPGSFICMGNNGAMEHIRQHLSELQLNNSCCSMFVGEEDRWSPMKSEHWLVCFIFCCRSNTSSWLPSIAVIPFFGPALYLLLRPALASSTIDGPKKSSDGNGSA